jgi:hypothetical protein
VISLLEAAQLFVGDYVRTTALGQPEVALVRDSGATTISWNGSHTSPLNIPFSDDECTVVAVADYLRDQVVDEVWQAWPECALHGTIADPTIIDGIAVWQCSADHVLARIGKLSSSEVNRLHGK